MKMILSLSIAGSLVLTPFVHATCELPSIESNINFDENLLSTQTYVMQHAHGNAEVLKTLHLFLAHLYDVYCKGEGLIGKDVVRILRSVEFAAQKHRVQTRKNPQMTPYIIHPIGVADHLLMVGHARDPDILIAAILHDTVEDTNTPFDEIRMAFGPRVEGFVREVTDDKSLSKRERKHLQILHAHKKSAGAAQIKLADKFYNLNDMLHNPPVDWDRARIDAYFDWAEKVVHGLPWVNAALLNAVDETIAQYRDIYCPYSH